MPLQPVDLLPIGFIVPGVAAGFLRRAEGGVGIIEGVCTNPLVSSSTRHKALDAVFRALLSTGCDVYIGWSVHQDVEQRVTDLGFRKAINYSMFVKEC